MEKKRKILDIQIPDIMPPVKISRRKMLGGAAAIGLVLMQDSFGKTIQEAKPLYEMPKDPTKVLGVPPGILGSRSPFEQPQKLPSLTSSRTPLQDLFGTITPADLHFERNHGGVPAT